MPSFQNATLTRVRVSSLLLVIYAGKKIFHAKIVFHVPYVTQYRCKLRTILIYPKTDPNIGADNGEPALHTIGTSSVDGRTSDSLSPSPALGNGTTLVGALFTA